jgi:ABC-2 type transport system permease protein
MSAPVLRRILSLFRKEVTESIRDWKMWSLTLSFAPFFVLLMYAYLGHATRVYDIAVVNRDEGGVLQSGDPFRAGDELVGALKQVVSEEGDTILRVRLAPGEQEAEADLVARRADVALVVPEGFSRVILAARAGEPLVPVPLRSRGDPANPDYLMAAVWVDMTTLVYVEAASGVASPAYPQPETVTGKVSPTEFDLYVPALLVLSLMMLMFTAAGALIREKDKGTIVRLRLSHLTAMEWLTAVSATQLLLGLLALALTYATAMAVGYRAQGSLAILLLVGALTSLSIMALSVLVAAFLRTVFDLVTVGCFPFFVLMFFSGGMFPLPGIPLFTVGGRTIQLNEILPTTHATTALNRVLGYGAGLGDIAYELGAMVVLTVAFYALGSWVFTRRHMPALG